MPRRTTPDRISFEDVCRAIKVGKQKNQLRKLVNFTFTRHPSINLSEERLQATKYHIQKSSGAVSIPERIITTIISKSRWDIPLAFLPFSIKSSIMIFVY